MQPSLFLLHRDPLWPSVSISVDRAKDLWLLGCLFPHPPLGASKSWWRPTKVLFTVSTSSSAFPSLFLFLPLAFPFSLLVDHQQPPPSDPCLGQATPMAAKDRQEAQI